MIEPHATYKIAEDTLSQQRIARVQIVVDGVRYGAFLPAYHDILNDQTALDTYMLSLVHKQAPMDYDALKNSLLVLRTKIMRDQKLSHREREGLKASILLLIMHVNHRKADGK